jgi:hypothetical protein
MMEHAHRDAATKSAGPLVNPIIKRIDLSLCDTRDGWQGGSARGQMQTSAAGTFHRGQSFSRLVIQ